MTVSPTLAINEEIARRRAAGLPTVALGFGEASIPVHPLLGERLAKHALEASYGPVAGAPELRDAAAGYWSRRGVPTTAGQVVTGPGSKPLLYALFQALGGPVVLPQPSWVSYAAQNALLGQQSVLVPTGGHGGVPEPDLLDREATRLRGEGRPVTAVLVTIPDNPTGTIAAPETVRALCDVAERHDITVISDEIYLDLVHDDATPVVTPAQLLPQRTITTSGLSKSLALGGWRIGLARFPETDLLARVRSDVLVSASEIWSAAARPVQLTAAWALTEPAELRERIDVSRALHGRIAREVARVLTDAGVDVPAPQAGFYLYPDFGPVADRLGPIASSPDLARALLDQHGIATLPGTAFGDDPDRLTLRIATSMLYGGTDEQRARTLESSRPEELPWIAEALADLATALDKLTR